MCPYLSASQQVATRIVIVTSLVLSASTAQAQRGIFGGIFGGSRNNDGGGRNDGGGGEQFQEPSYQQPRPVEVVAPTPPPAPAVDLGPLELVPPKKNVVPLDVTVADATVGRKVGAELDALLDDALRRLLDDTRGQTFTDTAREDFLRKYVSAGTDPMLSAELRNALIDLDPELAERACKKLGLPQRATEEMLPRLRLGGMLDELRKLVRTEDSTEKIASFERRFQTSARDFELDRAARETLTTGVEAILDSLRVRLAVTEKPRGAVSTLVPAPAGEVPVILYPPLAPAGRVYLVGDGVLVVGKNQAGAVVVAKAQAVELLGLPRSSATPAEEVSEEAARLPPRAGTVIYNPKNLGKTIAYTINGNSFNIKPGENQELPPGAKWIIAFDRQDKTQARYTLGSGCYAFTQKNNRLDIAARKCTVSIDNPAPSGEFYLVVWNEPATLPAGKALSLSSEYPIIVAFDRGPDGGVSYKKLWGGEYSLALKPGGTVWDLFPLDAQPSEAGELLPPPRLAQ